MKNTTVSTPVSTPVEIVEDAQSLQRAWDALQSVPSYCEENARQFAYVASLTPEQARERLQSLLNEEEDAK